MTYYPNDAKTIRDAAYNILAALPDFKSVYKGRTLPIKPDDDLPACLVWNLGEKTTPQGDPNCGTPAFMHDLTLAVEVVAAASDDATLDVDICDLTSKVRAALLTNSYWVTLFEGIESADLHYIYPETSQDTIVRGLINITVTFRSIWEPIIENDLKKIAIETVIDTPNYDNHVYTEIGFDERNCHGNSLPD